MIIASTFSYFHQRVLSLKYFSLVQFLIVLNYVKFYGDLNFSFAQYSLAFFLLLFIWRIVDDFTDKISDAKKGYNHFGNIATKEVFFILLLLNTLLVMVIKNSSVAAFVTTANFIIFMFSKLRAVYPKSLLLKNILSLKYAILPFLTSLHLTIENFIFGLFISLSVLQFDQLESKQGRLTTGFVPLALSLTTSAFYFSTMRLPFTALVAILMLFSLNSFFKRTHFLSPYFAYFVLFLAVIEEKFFTWN